MEINFKEFYNKHKTYKDLREGNNDFSNKYLDDVIHWKIKFMMEIAKSIKPQSILEIGCGVGILLANLPFDTKLSKRTGIDISDENIKIAKKKISRN